MRFAPPTRQIRIIIAAFAVAAAFLWVAAFTALWTHPREGLPAVLAAAACAVTIVGAMIWAVGGTRDRDKDLLLRSMADLSQRAGRRNAPTLPLRLRAVNRKESA